MDGWVKIYRKLIDWQWFKKSEVLHLFIYLLLKANHKDSKWQGIEVKRGQLITGRNELSIATGISEQAIRTCIARLKSTSEITVESTNKFSIITICNYDNYQSENNESNQQINQQTNQQPTSNQPATNQQPTTNKNDKKNKNDKNVRRKENTIDFSIFSEIELPIIEKWVNYRKSIKKPLTQQAIELIKNDMIKNTLPYVTIQIENSIKNGWQGLFEVKDFQNQTIQQTSIEKKMYAKFNLITGEEIEIPVNKFNEYYHRNQNKIDMENSNYKQIMK